MFLDAIDGLYTALQEHSLALEEGTTNGILFDDDSLWLIEYTV